MAYDFIEQRLKQTAPVQQLPTSTAKTIVPPAKVNTPVQNVVPKTTSTHGSFFTGNPIEKGFDILRTPEYAYAGFSQGLKENIQGQKKAGTRNLIAPVVAGIKNILPGIKNRQQISNLPGDFNLADNYGIKNPKLQSVVNFGASLAVPGLPIGKGLETVGKVGKVTAKLPLATKITSLGGKVANVVKNTPSITKYAEKLPGLEYMRNPEAGKILEDTQKVAGSRISKLYNQINDVAKGLTSAERVRVGQLIEGGVTANPSNRLSLRANYINQISDEIGKELVDLGVMSPESFANFKGKYLAHIADVVKNTENTGVKGNGVLKFSLNSLKQRKNKLGAGGLPDYVREFQFPTFKALAGEIQTAQSTKAIKEIVAKYGKTESAFEKTFGETARKTKEGLVALEDLVPPQIAKTVKGIAVPQEVADYVSKKYAKNAPGLLDKVASKALSFWKAGKTIYGGPAYHVRNLLSNQILSDFATQAGLPRTLAGYARAVKAYTGKGTARDMAYLQELKDVGVIGRQNIAGGVEAMKPDVFGKSSKLGKIADSPKAFQNASEETAKLNVYSFFRDKGMSVEEAAKRAEEAIFSPYNISQTERGLVRNAIPFYSFTRQAAPFVAKTVAKYPSSITKYAKAKTAVESLSPEGVSQDKNLPKNMSGQIRLPIKDKEGNYNYFDPTYIYPFGNFGQGGDQGQLPLGLGINPLLTEPAQQIFNKDLYFNQPIAKSNIPRVANEQRLAHAARTFLPQLFTPIQQLKSAVNKEPDYAGRTRSIPQTLLNAVGVKSAVYRPQDQERWDSIDKNTKIKAIRSEISSLMKNKSFSPEEKARRQKELLQVLQDTLRQ